MEYGLIALFVIGEFFIFIKLKEIQKKIQLHQTQIDNLCKATGNQHLTSVFISESDKEHIRNLKNSGKEVEAVKRARELTTMDLVQAKEYVDRL